MFDPLFPLALICGPLAFIFILNGEARRADRSIWPKILSFVLVLPAVWGLSYWVFIIAVTLFGEGMSQAAFNRWNTFSPMAPAIFLAAIYCWMARRRRRGVATSR